ncbi:hypothetical protein GBA52_003373 [Prunus armeniaca]|nr:hypothetical protein GBA52_003373 [Prunus armeniaca]
MMCALGFSTTEFPSQLDSFEFIDKLFASVDVFVNAWAIGRDPSIWDNPSSFVPERFLGLDDQIDVTGKNFELIPFGAGRRICPGLSWTMRILPLMLGSLINSFEWKLEDGILPETLNMEEKFGLTLQMAHPLRAVPKSFCEI